MSLVHPPDSNNWGAFIITVIAVCWIYRILSRRHTQSNAGALPGPPPLPLVGNLFQIPSQYLWLACRNWCKELDSDIIQLRLPGGKNIVVLDTFETATDLLSKKSAVYSDRPHLPMLNDLLGFTWSLGCICDGERFKDMRRVLHKTFNPDVVKRYRNTQLKATHRLLYKLLREPNNFMESIHFVTASIMLEVLYGIDVQSEDDPFLRDTKSAMHGFISAINAGEFLVNMIPILKYVPEWFPGAGFQIKARKWRLSAYAMLNKTFENVETRMARGDRFDCAATQLLDDVDNQNAESPYIRSIIKTSMGAMVLAATDTTVTALISFILAMVLYPKVQQKAQDEIDKVIGKGTLPSFSDFGKLPYIDAIVNETLRWYPVGPLGFPHCLKEEDVYKGSIVYPNVWTIFQDEDMYPEPARFNPDRYFKDGLWNPDVRDPALAAFGFGKRICPGRFLAKDFLWIMVSSILAMFTIGRALDENGDEITPEEAYSPGLLSSPLPFKCTIRARSEEHEAFVLGTQAQS